MFAVVRTGGKQYRVAPGDKIVVERLDGNAGDQITLGEVLLAGDGGDLRSTAGLTVAAEIIAQAKADKIIVFKKKRRHNYRRKKGHRQQHTILKIIAIGDQKEQKKTASEQPKDKVVKASSPSDSKTQPKPKITPDEGAGDIAGKPTSNPAPEDQKAAGADKPAAKKKAPAKSEAKTGSTKNAAPAKAAAKKSPKKK